MENNNNSVNNFETMYNSPINEKKLKLDKSNSNW